MGGSNQPTANDALFVELADGKLENLNHSVDVRCVRTATKDWFLTDFSGCPVRAPLPPLQYTRSHRLTRTAMVISYSQQPLTENPAQ